MKKLSKLSKLMIVKVGSDERPAGDVDIEQVRKELNRAIAEKIPFVTHHAVEIDILPIDDIINLNVEK